ncbi:MAG TPA: amidohydrolase family protein [Phycisphaerales bacterium]|nr:amidohydrolase family protein [Phycisphaerales bacterium]
MKPLAAPALAAGVIVLSLASLAAHGQPSSTSPLAPPANGPRRVDPTLVAITDTTIHTKPGETLHRAAVIFQEGRIIAVLKGDAGPDGTPGTEDDTPARTPVGPRIIPGAGLHLYPAFIEPFIEVDAASPVARDGGTKGAEAHWSPNVTPQRSALDGAGIPDGEANALRELGFAAAAIAPKGGVIKGSSAVVSLAKPSPDASAARPSIYRDDAYQNIAFNTRAGGYPDSQMGAIALIRQTLSDADWQQEARKSGAFTEPENALDVLAKRGRSIASIDAPNDTPEFAADATARVQFHPNTPEPQIAAWYRHASEVQGITDPLVRFKLWDAETLHPIDSEHAADPRIAPDLAEAMNFYTAEPQPAPTNTWIALSGNPPVDIPKVTSTSGSDTAPIVIVHAPDATPPAPIPTFYNSRPAETQLAMVPADAEITSFLDRMDVPAQASPALLDPHATADTSDPAPILLFQSEDELEFLRAAKIAREFERPFMVLGSGEEFARLDAIKKETQEPNFKALFLPLNFPKAPDVSTPGKAESVELRDMMTWEQSPTNPRRLHAAAIEFSLTTAKLRRKGDFLGNLRKAIAHGLPADTALAALTTRPAAALGVADQLGTIEPGKRANLLLTDGDVFSKKTKLRTLFIDGLAHELFTPPTTLEGEWDVTIPGAPPAKRWLSIDKDNGITVHMGDKETKAAKTSVEKMTVGFSFDHEAINEKPKKDKDAEGAETKDAAPAPAAPPALTGHYLMSASIERDAAGAPARLIGQGVRANGERFTWTATRRPPSIAGEWPMFFETDDPAHQRGGVLRITEEDDQGNRAFKLDLVQFADDGKETVTNVPDAAWDGKTLTATISHGTGDDLDTPVTATVDRDTTPHTLRGTMKVNDGLFPSQSFTARRVDPKKWWVGRWRVYEFDGERKEKDAKDNVEVQMTEKGATVEFINQPWAPPPAGKDRVSIKADDFKAEGVTITFKYSNKDVGQEGDTNEVITRVDGELHGLAKEPGGAEHRYKMRPVYDDKKDEDDEAAPTDIPEKLGLPFGPYAMDALPAQGYVQLTNATVWTNTDRGTLENATVILSGGKVAGVFPAGTSLPLPRPDAEVVSIDCAGKHIAPGIIDAHSHTGISKGVNEGAQACTAEVRIQDVTNPDDVNWYRQLAGGVTAVLQLHGSANSIGGQSQTTKVRWGVQHPDDMHFEGAIPGIKFALGENPRSVNWDAATGQYPRTRMGVEMLIRDRFTAAKEYAADAKHRRDLELEALADILAGTRLVHAHSYRQDEMVMLATVAGEFNFKLGTYTHALEGYKVADFVKKHAIGASGFTDWWAYKVEVQDAIPFAFPLMHKAGVTVSFNSDSNELARRLNSEAGKAIKYGQLVGGISQEEALKMVTLNPAIQLKVENRVGTIEAGKDADLVVWTANPLSSFARAERTFVDGRELFSLEKDKELRARNSAERTRLIQKLLSGDKKKKADGDKPSEDAPAAAPAGGRRRRGPGVDTRPTPPSDEYAGATSVIDDLSEEERAELRRFYMELMTSGKDPRFAPGVCGCGQLHAY